MKKFYTMKDICKLLNITRETLRHYEREGLIHPEINITNQYRLYDEHQMYLISECRRYQQNGFTLDEIRSMLEHDDLETYTKRIAEREQSFCRMIEEYRMKYDLIRQYHEQLSGIDQKLNHPETAEMEEIYFAPQRSQGELRLSESDIMANRFMSEKLYVTFMMMRIHNGNSEWGFGMYGRFIPESTDNCGLVRISASKAVRMIADCADEDKIDEIIRIPMCEFAQQNGFECGDDLVLIQLFRSGTKKDTHRYFEAYLPLKI